MLRTAFLLAVVPLVAWAGHPADEARLNQIQCLGSDNSYKEAIDASLWKVLNQENPGRFDMVRTRADSGTTEAREGDYATMKAAFASGAQYVSTDYYRPNLDCGTGYQVELPGGGSGRWNPLLLPAERPLPNLAR